MSMRIPQMLIAQDYRRLALAWTPSHDKDVAGYDVYLSSTIDGAYTKLNGGRIPSSPEPMYFIHVGSGSYYFKIRAYDATGNYTDSEPSLVQV